MSSELTELRDRISSFSDEVLLAMVHADSTSYRQEAVHYAAEELRRRGLPISTGSTMTSLSQTAAKDTDGKARLLFVCFTLILFFPLYEFVNISYGLMYEVGSAQRDRILEGLILILLIELGLTCFSIYAGITLWRGKEYAVKLANRSLTLLIVYFLLSAALGASILYIIGAIWAGTCYSYLDNWGTHEETVPRYKGVGGWLLVFVLEITVIYPLLFLDGLIRALLFYSKTPGLSTLASIIVTLFQIGMMLFSVYTGIALWRLKSNGVKIAKVYCVVLLVLYLSSVVLGTVSGQGKENLTKVFLGGLGGAAQWTLWYVYLCRSKRVKTVYPKGTLISG
jgi:hypothetical protein